MGDTFNAFVKFISDDPIMLGLCIAIVVLVILFIIVLFIGKKSDKKDEIEKKIDEFKDDSKEINIEDFTGPVTVINEDNEAITNEPEPTIETVETPILAKEETKINEEVPSPVLEGTKTTLEEVKEIPVTIEEPIALEINTNELGAPTLEENISDSIDTLTTKEPSNIPSFDDLKITVESPTIVDEEKPLSSEEVPSMNVDNMNTFKEDIPEPLDEASIPSIVESSVNPIEENIFDVDNNVFKNYTTKEEPIIEEVKEEKPIVPIEEPKEEIKTDNKESNNYSSVYLEDIELPEIIVDEFDKTAVIKNIPKEKTETPKENIKKENDDLDIDLPKLNPENNNSVMNSVKGGPFEF